MFTEQLSQALSCYDKIDPSNAAAGTATSTYIDMQKFRRCMYEIQIGAITGAGTLDAKLQTSANSNFNVAHDMTLGAITQVTNANPNSRVTLETTHEAVQQQNPGDRYVRLSVTVTANNVLYGATGWGGEAPQKPAKAQDPATVLQRLVVS